MSSHRTPVRTLLDLGSLAAEEIMDGYRDGRTGGPCGDNRSRGYWHGWRNGMMDSGRLQQDEASAALARDFLACQRRRRH